jgi:hypothetical protein
LITISDAIMTANIEKVKQDLANLKHDEGLLKPDFDIFVYPFEKFVIFKAGSIDLRGYKCSVTVIFSKTQGILYIFRKKIFTKPNEIYFTEITQLFEKTDDIIQNGNAIFQLKYDKITSFEFSQKPDNTYEIIIYAENNKVNSF